MQLPMLDKDKANHVVYGVAIYLALAVMGAGIFWAFFFAVLCGIVKEVYDGLASDYGTVSWEDAVATAFGGGIGLAISLATLVMSSHCS